MSGSLFTVDAPGDNLCPQPTNSSNDVSNPDGGKRLPLEADDTVFDVMVSDGKRALNFFAIY